jgi:hypothetical protein
MALSSPIPIPIVTDDVDTPQLLEVVLGPPSGFTRLFIFTGTASTEHTLLNIARDDDTLFQPRVDLALSQVHGNKPFGRDTTQVVAGVSPSSIHGTDSAREFTWAVDRAFADITRALPSPIFHKGELVHHVDIAIQGEGGVFSRFAYQVFVQTVGMQIVNSEQAPPNPIRVSTTARQSVSFDIKLIPFTDPSAFMPGGQVNFRLTLDGSEMANSLLGLPDSIDIPPLAASADIIGTVNPDNFNPFPVPRKLDFVLECATTLGVFRHQISVFLTE